MKKILLASIITLAATAASALEITTSVVRDYSGDNRNGGSLTLSNSYGKVKSYVGVERSTRGGDNQSRFTVGAGYDVIKVGPATVALDAGVSYLNNQVSDSGYALTLGTTATVPVTTNVSAVVGVSRQYGQSRVQQFDGNRITAGIAYKF